MFCNLWSGVQKLSPWCDAKVESIIPNEGKLLFLGVLNLAWLDRAFVLLTEDTWCLRSIWSSVLMVPKIAVKKSS